MAAVAVLLLSAVSSACLEAPQSLELRRLSCEVEKQMAAVKAKVEPGPSRNSRNSRNPCTSYAFENSKALFLSINLSLAPPYKTYKDSSFDCTQALNLLSVAVSCCQLLSVCRTVGCRYWLDFLCLGASILSASPSRADFPFWSRGAAFRSGSSGPLLLSQLSKDRPSNIW